MVHAARIKVASTANLPVAVEAEEGLHRSPRSRSLNEQSSFLPKTLLSRRALMANWLTKARLDMPDRLCRFAEDDASEGRQARKSGSERIYPTTMKFKWEPRTSVGHPTGSLTPSLTTNARTLTAQLCQRSRTL